MIWDSISLMAVVDLLIVGGTGSALAYLIWVRRRTAPREAFKGFFSIGAGLALVAFVYLLDLLAVYVLPWIAPMPEFSARMAELHHEFRWMVSLFSVGLISFGLISANRHGLSLIERLGASEKELRQELVARERSKLILQKSEARLKRAQSQAKLGYWRWSLEEKRLTYWSEVTAQICGYRPEDQTIGYDQMASTLHPDDRERVINEYRAADSEGRDFELEYRIMGEDGETRHVREIGEIEYGRDGKPVGHVGTVQDITELKNAAKALSESEQRFRDIAETASDWFWEMDENLRFTYVSERFEPSMGVPIGEVIGRTRQEVFAQRLTPFEKQNEAKWKRHYDILEKRLPYRDLEVVWAYPDGSERTFLSSGKPLFDESGKFRGYRGTALEITKRVRAEQALRESETQFRNLVEGSMQGVVIQRDFVPLFANQTYAGIHGYQNPDEVLSLGSITPLIVPEEMPRLTDYGDARLRGDKAPERYEFQGVRKDGAIIWLENTATVVTWNGSPAILSTVIDITERRQAEEALRASEARFAGILGIAAEAVIAVDEDMHIQLFNQGAEKIFGYSVGEIKGQPLDLLLPEQFRERHTELIREFAHLPETSRLMGRRSEIVGLRKDGSQFPAEASISKLEQDGVMTFTIMLRDVTHRREAEREILLSKQDAELANRAKSDFLANMSHELRTPLNAIIGFSDLLKDEVFGPLGSAKYRGYAKDISDSGQHLLAIISDILDLSKIETGSIDLREESLDVHEVIRVCLSLMTERAEAKGIELISELPGKSGPALRADPRIVKQILLNLLSNAVKFTPSGGRVTVSSQHGRKMGYVLRVSDTGIGMAPDEIPRALSRFGQIGGPFERTYEGTGLGLPLSKSFVELHGGTLELTSEPKVGTTATVTFPPGRIVPLYKTKAPRQVLERKAG